MVARLEPGARQAVVLVADGQAHVGTESLHELVQRHRRSASSIPTTTYPSARAAATASAAVGRAVQLR